MPVQFSEAEVTVMKLSIRLHEVEAELVRLNQQQTATIKRQGETIKELEEEIERLKAELEPRAGIAQFKDATTAKVSGLQDKLTVKRPGAKGEPQTEPPNAA